MSTRRIVQWYRDVALILVGFALYDHAINKNMAEAMYDVAIAILFALLAIIAALSPDRSPSDG